MSIKALRGADGRYRVPFPRAWRLTTISRVVAEDTGEPLVAADRTLSRIGAWFGIAAALAVNSIGLFWLIVLDARHTAVVLPILLAVIAIIFIGLAYTISRNVTYVRRS